VKGKRVHETQGLADIEKIAHFSEETQVTSLWQKQIGLFSSTQA